MGDLDVGSYRPILAALPFTVAAFAVFAILPRTLNLLTMGEDVAAAGASMSGRAQRLAFFSASLATGAAVSLGGPVGFIGIVVPHLVRLMVGRTTASFCRRRRCSEPPFSSRATCSPAP